MTVTPQYCGPMAPAAPDTIGDIVSPEKAMQTVRELNSDEADDWTYEVYTHPEMDGAKVRVTDEEGVFVTFMDFH